MFERRVVNFHIDGAWKANNPRGGLGFYATHHDGTIFQQCSVACHNASFFFDSDMPQCLALTN